MSPMTLPLPEHLELQQSSAFSRLAEALRLVRDASRSGAVLGPACFDHVIRSLLAEGSMEDAMAVKSM